MGTRALIRLGVFASFVVPGLTASALTFAGCGLALDYGPPDPVSMDAGRGDANGNDGAVTCASGCDDGLRCTADSCNADVCEHADTCPGDTDCVARGGGECRRACASASDCDDHIDCTDDFCSPTDGHCGHTNTCQSDRPVCLESGVCAPERCSNDSDCDDGNACNGSERCISETCRAGTHVACDPGSGCMTQACNPETGTCEPVLDASACDDGFACTSDVCNADGTCANPPNDDLCASANLCEALACDPTAPLHDVAGCAVVATRTCPMACGASISCTPATGLCNFNAACPMGQVCRADGCHAPGSCSSDTQCTGILGPGGCTTSCIGGTCQPTVCPLPTAGTCAEPVSGCPTSGRCFTANPALCADSDPNSIDTCNPDTFACSHSCPPPNGNDCVTYTYAGGRCVPSFDSTICAHLHPPGADCARYACVGHDPGGGGGTDGCAPVAVNGLCNDFAGCTDDVCVLDASSGVGSCESTVRSDVATFCNDAIACTSDACDPASAMDSTGCTHVADDTVCTDAAGALDCAVTGCSALGAAPAVLGTRPLPSGCTVSYMPLHCGLVGPDICTLDGQCTVVPCGLMGGTRCDDGNGCNGTELCNVALGHCTQVAPLTMCMTATTGGP